MNYSRLFSIIAQKQGYNTHFNVGRVQTPTLSLVVRRESEISTFKPVTYYTIKAIFNTLSGETFTVRWKPKKQQPGLDESNRLIDPLIARNIIETVNTSNRTCIVTDHNTIEKQEAPPLPYSLSNLQIEASKKFGLKPSEVLEIVQFLYEKKLTTYPRSDCSYLPENQYDDAKIIIHNLKLTGNKELKLWANAANIKLKSRAWDDKKISAHHAIIPTQIACNFDDLNENHQKIYTLISRAYIAQYLPAHKYLQTNIEFNCAGELFTTSGRIISEVGWKILLGGNNLTDEENEDENKNIPFMSLNDEVKLFTLAGLEEKQTKPPLRFTEGTLLAAMKNIYIFLHNENLREVIKNSGLGTEATRSAIIKSLITNCYLLTEKKGQLIPTEKAVTLFKILPSQLTYPDATAMMEQKLELLAEGSINTNDIIQDQLEFINNVLSSLIHFKIDLPANRICPDCKSPLCRKQAKERKIYFWGCTNYPNCKKTFSDKNGEPETTLPPKYPCPLCDGSLIFRKTHDFWGCSNWKEGCKGNFDNIKDKPLIKLCPACEKEYLREQKNQKDILKCKNCNSYFNLKFKKLK